MLRPDPTSKYKSIREAVEHDLKLTTGTVEDRLLGLQPLLDRATGQTVLDIGCHVGTIAEAFARQGAKLIHGVDLYRPGLREARARLRAYGTPAHLKLCDLTGGMEALRAALPKLRSAYDVVLYLGMHHHLAKQMPSPALAQFMTELQSVARVYFAVRTTPALLADLHEGLLGRGFTLWEAHESYPRPVGPVRIYRRS